MIIVNYIRDLKGRRKPADNLDRYVLLALVIFPWFIGGCPLSNLSDVASPQSDSSESRIEAQLNASGADADDALILGETVYSTYCAECHGANGEGQANWRQRDEQGVLPAPPHDSSGHTWHHPDQVLLEIIANGSGMPKSKMIAYRDLLTDEEMEAVLSYIKTFWGENERDFQEQVTDQYQE